MTETTDNGVITKESTGKKDKKQNLWKMFRRKKGNNTASTSQMSKLQKQNAKNTLEKDIKTSSPVINGRFADEDDLFVEVDAANSKHPACTDDMEITNNMVISQKRQNVSDEDEDAGVCLASVSSSSPASSRGPNGRRCRSVCAADITTNQCENLTKERVISLMSNNSCAPVAQSTPEEHRKQKSVVSNSVISSNSYIPMFNKNNASNIRESNKRIESIRQPRPASCTFGTNGSAHATLEDFLASGRDENVSNNPPTFNRPSDHPKAMNQFRRRSRHQFNDAVSVCSSHKSSASRMSMAPHPDEICPVCSRSYDQSSGNRTRRKLIDSQCGHGRCFECMFRYSECPICFNGIEPEYDEECLNQPEDAELAGRMMRTDQYGRNSSNFASIHNRGCSRRSSDLVPRMSAFSKESGFQSSHSSISSVYSGSKHSKYSPIEPSSHYRQSGQNTIDHGYSHSIMGDDPGQRRNGYIQNGMICENDDDTESVISLMSCQSIAPTMQQFPLPNRILSPTYASQFKKSPNMGGTCLNMIPEDTLRRNDFKRHSLTSLRKIQGVGSVKGSSQTSQRESSIGSRNSVARRSLINPRFNIDKSSAIEKFNVPIDSGDWPLKPLFFEVPKTTIFKSISTKNIYDTDSFSRSAFVGRKWIFREILEHFTTDLPTSGGIIIQGSSATGKTRIIQHLVQNSCFGHIATSMSNSMDILAREVVAYHFCQMDNEPSCLIPHFVHSISAQMSQTPNLVAYRRLIASDEKLKAQLSMQSCLDDPKQSFVKGVLEPLLLLRSQGKLPMKQRCIILVDGICEAESHRTDAGDSLATFLSDHLNSFPKWLRVICTVRSNMIDLVKGFPFHRLSLDNAHVDERLHKDTYDFVWQQIRDSEDIRKNITPLCTQKVHHSQKSTKDSKSNSKKEKKCAPKEDANIATIEASNTMLADYLIRASSGCILYADRVLNLFRTGKLQVKLPSSFNMIPLSLSEVYLLEFNLMFPSQESFLRIKDILAVCLASLKPLTPIQIYMYVTSLKEIYNEDEVNSAKATKPKPVPSSHNMSWEEFSTHFDMLTSWLLPERADKTVMFFHSTVKDWLLGRRTVDSTKFVIDPRKGHAAIALHLSRKNYALGPEDTLELCHHLLKANLFKSCGNLRYHGKDQRPSSIYSNDDDSFSSSLTTSLPAKDMQALLILNSTRNASEALACPINVSAPNIKVSRLLLLSGASPDTIINQKTNESLMSRFAAKGNVEMIRMLGVEFGGNTNISDLQGTTPLMAAAFNGNLNVLKQLVHASGASLSMTDSRGSSALVYAVKGGHRHIVEFFLACENWMSDAIEQDENGAIYSTIENKDPKQNETFQEALIWSAKLGHIDILEVLLSNEDRIVVDINKKCALTGETALYAAASSGRLPVCQLLIRHGAEVMKRNMNEDIKANPAEDSPLYAAIAEGHYSIVELFLNHFLGHPPAGGSRNTTVENIDSSDLINESCDKLGRCPLSVAAAEGQVGVIELLLSRNANIECKSVENGLSPLIWAIIGCKVNAVDLLLKAGANLNAVDAIKRTPFHHVAISGSEKVLAVLLDHLDEHKHLYMPVDPSDNEKQVNAYTIRQRFTSKHKENIIENADKDGVRPIDLAIAHGNETILAKLLKRGAKLGPTTWAMAKGKPRIALILLNKLLEDGNTLFRNCRFDAAAYRYEYALKRIPRLKPIDDNDENKSTETIANNKLRQKNTEKDDVFSQLRIHLLLNLSRTKRKQTDYEGAISYASKVLEFCPDSFEALWAAAKAKKEFSEVKEDGGNCNIDLLESALTDLRNAIRLAPQNLELHRYTIRVKEELDKGKKKKVQGDNKPTAYEEHKEHEDQMNLDVGAA